jgi:hypothetical protein
MRSLLCVHLSSRVREIPLRDHFHVPGPYSYVLRLCRATSHGKMISGDRGQSHRRQYPCHIARAVAGSPLTNPNQRANRTWRYKAYHAFLARSLVRLLRQESMIYPSKRG